MKLDNVFKKTRIAVGRKNYITFTRRPEVPEGLLRKCNKCGGAIIAEDVKKDHYICPKCGGYFRVHARRRIEMITDEGSFEEWDSDLQGGNPLEYKGYEEKLKKLQEKTGLSEAVVTGKAKIDGREAAIGVCDGRFLMASMGEAVGEKIARAVERATKERLPVILFACSGGARMQEGIVSLMQMAKTSAALKRHSDAGLLYISVLTDPTTGGVTASFAMLGDVILAEPKALIGFAGPRVIEQTIGQKLPDGFQRAEFLLEHGFLDAIVERPQMKETLSKILDWSDRSTCVLFGDGAGCAIVEADEEREIFIDAGSDGAKGDVLTCEERHLNNLLVKDDSPMQQVAMDGQEVFKFAARMVPKSINKVLDEAGVSKEEIKYFVLHQANKRIIEAAARRLKQPIEKFPMNIDRCANTSSATIPILLDEINQKGMLNRGDKIVLSGFGGGLTWGSVYLTW